MKNKRRILFRALAILVLVAIAACMMYIGRGHTMYFDNRTLEYGGNTYKTPYKIEVYVDGERVAKLYDRERGMAPNIGPKFSMRLKVTQEKGGDDVTYDVSMPLPYSIDGIIINLPGLLAGLPQEAYISEFIPAPEENVEEEAPVTEEDMLSIESMSEEMGEEAPAE